MKKINSNIDPALTIAVIETIEGIDKKRCDLTAEEEALQLSSCVLHKDHVVKAHFHNIQERNTTKTQESLIVVDGSIKVTLFDIDHKTPIKKETIEKGGCVILLNGGHEIEILENNTKFYEFKNGPYLGREKDKTLI